MNKHPIHIADLAIRRSPALTKKAERVDPADPQVKAVCLQMMSLARAAGGIGLAAPQIGLSWRVAVCLVDGGWQSLVNPKIVEQGGGRVAAFERCLSLPNVRVEVSRAWVVRIHHEAEDGSVRALSLSGDDARIAQHEIDHLNGVLITSRAVRKGRSRQQGKRGNRWRGPAKR